MQWKFQRLYQGLLGLCLCGVLWSVWVSAQETGPSVPATQAAQTNKVLGKSSGNPAPAETMEKGYLTFGLDHYPILRDTKVLEIPLWQYIASLLYIFLAFWSVRLLDYFTKGWLKKWAGKTSTTLDDLLIELFRGPIKVVAFVTLLNIGLTVFAWPTVVERWLVVILVVVVAVSITYMLMKLVDVLLAHWAAKATKEAEHAFDQLLFPVIRKSLKLFIVVVSTLLTTSNLGINITGVLASLSIGGLAIGLAAQDTLANLFGAVAIFMDKPFLLGDRIRLENVDGNVESIGLRSTRVRNLDGHLITVPNKTMGNSIITNISRRPNIKTVLLFGLTYETPTLQIKRAIAILDSVYKQHPKTFEATITFQQFAESSLNIEVVHWWSGTDHKAYLEGLQSMNLDVKERFDSEQINLAFPTRTVYLKQEQAT